MNAAQLFSDIDIWLRKDIGQYGLFPTVGTPLVTGFFNNWANPNQEMPYLVFTVISSPQDDCFAVDMSDVDFQISLFAAHTKSNYDRAQRIIDRVYGDAIRNAGSVPTYGLHRWTGPSATGWVGAVTNDEKWLYTNFRRKHVTQAHGEDYYHFVEEYGCRMFKTYASTQ